MAGTPGQVAMRYLSTTNILHRERVSGYESGRNNKSELTHERLVEEQQGFCRRRHVHRETGIRGQRFCLISLVHGKEEACKTRVALEYSHLLYVLDPDTWRHWERISESKAKP